MRILALSIAPVLSSIGLYSFYRVDVTPLSSRSCVFCKESILESQKFYEDSLVYGLYTHRPIFEGHCLVIPKRHVERFDELSSEEISQMCEVVKKINKASQIAFNSSSYLLLQKNGIEVGQSVPHVHIHYVPRKEGDSSAFKFILKMFIVNFLPPMTSEQLKNPVEKMKHAINLV